MNAGCLADVHDLPVAVEDHDDDDVHDDDSSDYDDKSLTILHLNLTNVNPFRRDDDQFMMMMTKMGNMTKLEMLS